MKGASLQSALADPIRQFVEYKQALNRKYRSEAAALRLFDRYLCEHHVAGWNSIEGVLIERFLQSRARRRPRSYNHLLGVVRRCCVPDAVVQRFGLATVRLMDNTDARIPGGQVAGNLLFVIEQ